MVEAVRKETIIAKVECNINLTNVTLWLLCLCTPEGKYTLQITQFSFPLPQTIYCYSSSVLLDTDDHVLETCRNLIVVPSGQSSNNRVYGSIHAILTKQIRMLYNELPKLSQT